MKRIATLAALALLATLSPAQAQGSTEAAFRAFLGNEIWPEARGVGVSRPTFDAALGRVRPDLDLPDLELPGRPAPVDQANRQAEFQSPSRYFDERSLADLAERGRRLQREHAALLARVERETGVPGPIVLAIWARESGYGTARIPHDAFRVLATKAWAARRKAMFRAELIAALAIVERGERSVEGMRSSWAGALGQPQFMPTKYLALARDGDGDGRRDIWDSVPDTLLSIGHYLEDAGWRRGRDWGFEVALPASVSCQGEGPDRMRPIRDFTEAGVRRVSGRPFPPGEARAEGALLLPAGRFGPAFVATPNFHVIKSYNNSDLYALFIGNLADRIAGGGAFRTAWTAPAGLTRGDVARMQTRLQAMNHDVGGADGLAGFKTRRSVGAFEVSAGLAETCWPTGALAARLR